MKVKDLLPHIKPNLHPKYSPNLYRWLKGNWPEEDDVIVVSDTADNMLFIGRFEKDLPSQESFCGAHLMRVLCEGKRAGALFYFNAPVHEADIDHGFWERYIHDGRCAIDADHRQYFVGDRSRWSYSGDRKHRSCLWCGNHTQALHEWEETVRKTDWRPVAVNSTEGAAP